MTLLDVLLRAADEASTNTSANVIAAIATVVTALGGLVLAVGVLIPILRTVRTTHTIVNQQRTDAQRYQVALVELLKFHGIEIPVDQSLPVPGNPVPAPGVSPSPSPSPSLPLPVADSAPVKFEGVISPQVTNRKERRNE